MNKQILAMGGGGFSMEPDNPLLDKYVLSLSNKENPKICFLGTASGDAEGYIKKFYDSFSRYNCQPTHFSLFKPSTSDIAGVLLKQDILYIGGGNTKNMLVLWREWGVDKLMFEAYEKGIVLAGISAGSICWFEQGLTDSIPNTITRLNCLGFLKGSNCPHYNSEETRRPAFHQLITENKILNGIASDDGVGLHYVDGHLEKVVSSHPDAKAYRLTKDKTGVLEKQIIPIYLGGQDTLIRRASLQDSYAIHEAHMKSIQELCSADYSDEQIMAWGHRQYQSDARQKNILEDYVWILESQGIIEGHGHLVISKTNPKEAEIKALYLTSKLSKHGYGKRMLQIMLDEAKNLGVKTIKLHSTITAMSFYFKNGFKLESELCGININSVDIPCYKMSLNL